MSKVKSYAALRADKPLNPYEINRREINSDDVNIDILYCDNIIISAHYNVTVL